MRQRKRTQCISSPYAKSAFEDRAVSLALVAGILAWCAVPFTNAGDGDNAIAGASAGATAGFADVVQMNKDDAEQILDHKHHND